MLTSACNEWITRLSRNDRDEAVKELQRLLLRALNKFEMSLEDKEDIVQSSTITILTNLKTFKGRSKFSTWAISIAINLALSERRKKHWSNISLEEAAEMGVSDIQYDKQQSPEFNAQRQWALGLIDSLIYGELTLKQRTALLAEMNGMPLLEIATRMNVSRGAIYKLTFDARKKLIKCLKEKGLKPSDVIASLE
jgi:RNA polymerase sigma-70 factor (ECF subfamily)